MSYVYMYVFIVHIGLLQLLLTKYKSWNIHDYSDMDLMFAMCIVKILSLFNF